MPGSVALEIERGAPEQRFVIAICERHLAELCAARRATPELVPPAPEVESPRRRFRRR
jgi:hypothetical protein